MGNLQTFKFDQSSKCLENCGVDYVGPFVLKCSNRQNSMAQKAYYIICVFVWLITKALHLELVC